MKEVVLIPSGHGDIAIGEGMPTQLVAEIGLNHNGSEEMAREMIKMAALSGATFVKFQKRTPDELATADFLDAPFSKAPSLGLTQRQVRNKLELSEQTYRRLKSYSEELGLIFSASAFDISSLNSLLNIEVRVIKVASHSITNGPLLREIAKSGIPVIASLGAATRQEQDQAIEILSNNPLILMHCVSSYPTPDKEMFLDTISALKKRYPFPVGFSSHELGIDISVAASVLGANVIERHFTLKRAMLGLDQSISLEPDEFADLATRIRKIYSARGASTDINVSENLARSSYHVAVCAKIPIKAGTLIEPDMLVCRQPLGSSELNFTGLEIESLYGQITKVDLPENKAISRAAIQ